MPSRKFRLNVIKALCEESKGRKRLTKVFDAPNKKVRSEFPAFGTVKRLICLEFWKIVIVEDAFFVKWIRWIEKLVLNAQYVMLVLNAQYVMLVLNAQYVMLVLNAQYVMLVLNAQYVMLVYVWTRNSIVFCHIIRLKSNVKNYLSCSNLIRRLFSFPIWFYRF